MASRKNNRLTARMVEQLKKLGYYGDGGGLVLRVADSGSKVWLFRYTTQGRVREMGLGPIRDASLAEAREGARDEMLSLSECMRRASRVVLRGFELRLDPKVILHPHRYEADEWDDLIRRAEQREQRKWKS